MRNSNSWRRTMYREKIAKLAPGYDPAHVEAYMRAATSLNIESISDETFAEILRVACNLVDHHGLNEADDFARRCGLRPQPRKATP